MYVCEKCIQVQGLHIMTNKMELLCELCNSIGQGVKINPASQFWLEFSMTKAKNEQKRMAEMRTRDGGITIKDVMTMSKGEDPKARLPIKWRNISDKTEDPAPDIPGHTWEYSTQKAIGQIEVVIDSLMRKAQEDLEDSNDRRHDVWIVLGDILQLLRSIPDDNPSQPAIVECLLRHYTFLTKHKLYDL